MNRSTTIVTLALGASLGAACLRNYHVVDGGLEAATDVPTSDATDIVDATPGDATDLVTIDTPNPTDIQMVDVTDATIPQDATDACGDACAPRNVRVVFPLSGTSVPGAGVNLRLDVPPDITNIGGELCMTPPPCGTSATRSLSTTDAGTVAPDGGVFEVLVPLPPTTGTAFLRVGEFHDATTPLSRTSPWIELSIVASPSGTPNPGHLSWGALPDVDGDGRVDLIVGGGGIGTDATFGNVYLWSGAALTSTSLVLADRSAMRVTGEQFGNSVAGAGDVNGDGMPDLVVGRPYGSNGGAIYYYPGRANFFAMPPMPQIITAMDVGLMNVAFGTAVAAAGDVDSDGYADIIVGAPSRSGSSGTAPAEAVVLFGSPTGVSAANSVHISLGAPALTFGQAVAGIGDLNNDGFSDVAIGAPTPSSGTPRAGQVTIGYGGRRSSLAAHFGMATFSAPTGMSGDRFGASIAAAGDNDNDGYADFVVGAPGSGNGFVLIAYGTSGMSYPMRTNSFTTTPASSLGAAVAGGHDFDGDGLNDIIAYSAEGGTYYFNASGVAISVASATSPPLASTLGFDGDIDGDGVTDLVTLTGDSTHRSVIVIAGVTTHTIGTFGPSPSDDGFGRAIASFAPWFHLWRRHAMVAGL